MKNTNATVAFFIIFGGAAPITAIGSKNGKIVAPAPMIPSPSGMPYPPPSVAQSSAKSGKERLRLRSATLCDLLDAAATPAAAAVMPDSSATNAYESKSVNVKSEAPTAGPSSTISTLPSITPSSPSAMPNANK